jgi:glyoxylase-like metal-dependent hydrolase (beta-lactamase superfamily II)
MKRGIVLGALIAIGALSMGVAAWQTPAQGTNVVTVDKVKDNLYVLKGGGGNTAVFITTDGVVVVDAKNPGWGQPILDKIKELTPKPVTMLINTHTHGDHVSGNVEFPATVEVIVQENTKANMEKMPIFAQNNNRGMARRTFKDKMTLGKGADEIDLYYFGPGHTNGDAWVVFPALRTVHAGDLFQAKALPLVDAANGGSVLHYAETLSKAHAGIKNVETVINGHSATTTTWDDLKLFAEFNQDFLTWAQAELKAGKTPEQAAAGWRVPEKYQGYSQTAPTMFGGVAGRLQLLADEMKRK